MIHFYPKLKVFQIGGVKEVVMALEEEEAYEADVMVEAWLGAMSEEEGSRRDRTSHNPLPMQHKSCQLQQHQTLLDVRVITIVKPCPNSVMRNGQHF